MVGMLMSRPAVVRVTWSLRDEKQDVVDHEHFTAPFILTVDQILAKVRNLTMREMPGGTLFPDVMQQYDDYSMREILHNCIAHQDYTLQERINLVENPGFLYYANGGSFIPGTVQKALATHGPQRHYRNECSLNEYLMLMYEMLFNLLVSDRRPRSSYTEKLYTVSIESVYQIKENVIPD